MESVDYIDFYKLAKQLEVRRKRILAWCNDGLLLARQPTKQEKPLVVVKDDRAYLKRISFGRKDPRTRIEWVNAFLAIVTRE